MRVWEAAGVLETAIALACLAALALLGVAFAAAPLGLLTLGLWLAAGGLVLGVPTGLVYHLALRRALLAAGRLPTRWWLRPTALHGAVPAERRASVLAWCHAGAAGFVISVAGCALVALASWRGF